MWAQDAAAMYGYAGSSAAATTLTPLTAPQQTTNPAAQAGQSAAVAQAAGTSAGTQAQTTLSQLTSAVPTALQQFTSPTSSTSGLSGVMNSLGLNIFGANSSTSTTGLAGMLNMIDGTNGNAFGTFLNNSLLNTMFSSGFYMPGNFLGTGADFIGLAGPGAVAAEVVPQVNAGLEDWEQQFQGAD